jgi:SpoIID/LytB domain protein
MSELTHSIRKNASDIPQYVSEGEMDRLEVARRSPAGRVLEVTTWWKWKGMKLRYDITSGKLRNWLGAQRVQSTWWESLVLASGKFVMKGRGFGHGVGMCQWGAKVMGENGKKMREILSHYYPGSKMVRLSELKSTPTRGLASVQQ